MYTQSCTDMYFIHPCAILHAICFACRPSEQGTQVMTEHTGTICLHLMLNPSNYIFYYVLHTHIISLTNEYMIPVIQQYHSSPCVHCTQLSSSSSISSSTSITRAPSSKSSSWLSVLMSSSSGNGLLRWKHIHFLLYILM